MSRIIGRNLSSKRNYKCMLTKEEIKEAIEVLNRERDQLRLKHKKETIELQHKFEMVRLECQYLGHPGKYNYKERDGYICSYCPTCELDR